MEAADELRALRAENRRLRERLAQLEAAPPDEPAASQTRLAALLEHAPEAIFIKDSKGRYRCVSRTFLTLVGKPLEEVLGRTDFDLFDKELAERFQAEDREVRETRQPILFEEQLEYGGGEVHFLTQKFLLPGGEVAGVATNTTERKQADEEIRQLAMRLTLATEVAGLATYELDLSTVKGLWSASAFRLIGVEPTENLVGSLELWRRLIHPDDREHVERGHQERARRGGSWRAEYRILRADTGELRWLSVYGRFVDRGGATISTGVAVDVTEQKAAEHELREAEARLRALTENLPGGMVYQIATSKDGSQRRFLYVSRSHEKLTGVPAAAVLADPAIAYELILPEDRDSLAAAETKALAARAPFDVEARIRRADGEIRWCRLLSAPREQEDGTLIWDGIQIDITERKAAELALLELNASLEDRVAQRAAELANMQEALRQSQKLESMGQLTGGVAHDFNNLLSPIIGGLDLLQRRRVGDERAQALLAGALAAAERARVLVQRLLAFARRQPLQPAAVDIAQLAEGLVGLLGSTVGPRIEVATAFAPGLPPALADVNQLEMALLNLAVNAKDAMPDGGRLTISAEAERVGRQAADGPAPGRYVRIAVADTGSGMDAATLARAIEPFFSTKGVGKGTGLGLSMVHGLAAQLGGKMAIASRPGCGTTVTLWLPIAGDEPSRAGAGGDTGQRRDRVGRALLVDDEDLVRVSTAEMMQELGYEVVERASAAEALEEIERGGRFDVLVTDHLMSGMTGAELAREVQGRLPEMRILIISGYAEVEGIAPDLARLSKPFRLADLAEALSR